MPFDASPSRTSATCVNGHVNPERGSSGQCLQCGRERVAEHREKEKRIAAIVARNTKTQPPSGLQLADDYQARKDARDERRQQARRK